MKWGSGILGRLDVTLICDLPPFDDMTRVDLDAFLAQARSIRIPKDSAIFEQGEQAHSFFFLLDGHVRVVLTTPDGEQVIARYISSGELIGIAQALELLVYPANAIAAVDCLVLAWPGAIWQQTITKFPGFAAYAYRTIGMRLQETQARIVEMATEKVEQRVASAVLKLAQQTGRKTDDGILIDFPLSRQDISEMTGTTMHTVSRLMSVWEAAGWVKTGRQRIIVVEGHKLMLLASGTK